jgi:hypothetical protein
MVIPTGTHLTLALTTPVASNTSHAEDRVQAVLSRAVLVNGVEVLPAGAQVTGVVMDAAPSGRVKGRAFISLRFDAIAAPGGSPLLLKADTLRREAPATTGQDAKKVGIGAGVGAVMGGLITKTKRGLGIGAAIGAGAGTADVLVTKGPEVALAPGSALSIRVAQPLTVLLPTPR